MADINPVDGAAAPPAPQRGPEPSSEPAAFVHADMMELLFFAYRDFIGDPDDILSQIGFGRAHHRVLHFVNRHPGMRVTDLLDILKITKQSLGRVLKQLLDGSFIIQEPGATDRRERLLYPTSKGTALARSLAEPQARRIEAALDGLDTRRLDEVRRFLTRMINPPDRARVTVLGGSRRS